MELWYLKNEGECCCGKSVLMVGRDVDLYIHSFREYHYHSLKNSHFLTNKTNVKDLIKNAHE